MLAATKVKMSGSQKNEQEHVRYFLHKACNQEVSHVVVVQNNGKRYKCTKKCAASAKLACVASVSNLVIRESY